MYRLRPLLFTAAAFSCAMLLAQPEKPKTKVVLYKDRIAAQWDTVNCVKNVIKVNPLLFFRGEIPVYFEHALSPRLSLELGVGVTYRNFLNLTIAGDNADADDFGAGTKIIPHPSFHIGARYYLTDDLEPQGQYLQVELAYLRYGKDISEKDSTGFFNGKTNRDDRTFNDVRLYYGYQSISGTSNWLFDVYAGVALRSRHLEIVNEQLDISAGKWNYTTEVKDDIVPAFFLGVKVGLGW
ncbi:MAG: hypothetical protein IPO90_08925 [Flavobacteriales bacterium]|nr:hypothetical protein [Flavobacteriales bacterium]